MEWSVLAVLCRNRELLGDLSPYALEEDLEDYLNIDMRDLRNVADFVSSSWRRESDPTVDLQASVILRRADCSRERGNADILRHEVGAKHPCFSQQGSGIANLLGLSLQAAISKAPPGSLDISTHLRLSGFSLMYVDINSTITGRPPGLDAEEAD